MKFSNKGGMSIKAQLKKVCKNCTEGTFKVYYNNVKRLYKLYDADEEPTGEKWLHSEKVKKAYEKLPLKSRRHLSTAGTKMAKAFGSKNEYWPKRLMKDAEAYSAQRGKNQKSDTEKAKWLKKGIKSLRKAGTAMWRKLKHTLDNESKPSIKTLYRYTQYMLIRLYGEIALRNTYATFHLKDNKTNNFVRNPYKGVMEFVIRDHKSSKVTGTRSIKPKRGIAIAFRKFLNYRKKVADEDNNSVFLNATGKTLTKGALSKLLHRVTLQELGKAVGSRIIRVMTVTEKSKEIKAAEELANSMLHSSETQKSYVRKDD